MVFLYYLIQKLFLLFLFSSSFLMLTLTRKGSLLLTYIFRDEFFFCIILIVFSYCRLVTCSCMKCVSRISIISLFKKTKVYMGSDLLTKILRLLTELLYIQQNILVLHSNLWAKLNLRYLEVIR